MIRPSLRARPGVCAKLGVCGLALGLGASACGPLLGVDFDNARPKGDGGSEGVGAEGQGEGLAPWTGALAIAAGPRHACAASARTVKCWGDLGQKIDPLNPLARGDAVLAPGLADTRALSSGAGLPQSGLLGHTCALGRDGGVRCWGGNAHGELGNGHVSAAPASVPAVVLGLESGVASIASGLHHGCARTEASAFLCWGDNTYGQLGLGTRAGSSVPVSVPLEGVLAASAGAAHTCALVSGGRVTCWGRNHAAQLGTGPTSRVDSLVPIDVDFGPVPARAVSAGGQHTCVILETGGVKCWGRVHRALSPIPPTDIEGLAGIEELAAGHEHTCARDPRGKVLCWGRLGGPGGGSTGNAPVEVPGLEGVTALALGTGFSCALASGGRVFCWGDNAFGQLGPGSAPGSSAAAVEVRGL